MKNMAKDLLSGFDNPTYINLILDEINLIKKLFVQNIEFGEETKIPDKLYQKDLPQCYKFYNPVLGLIEDTISDDKRCLYR